MTAPVLLTEATELAGDIAGIPGWMRETGSKPWASPGVVARIQALQAAADAGPVTVEDARRIFGSPSRYLLLCDGCGEHHPAVVRVGDEPDYDSATASLCKSCLLAALALFEVTP